MKAAKIVDRLLEAEPDDVPDDIYIKMLHGKPSCPKCQSTDLQFYGNFGDMAHPLRTYLCRYCGFHPVAQELVQTPHLGEAEADEVPDEYYLNLLGKVKASFRDHHWQNMTQQYGHMGWSKLWPYRRHKPMQHWRDIFLSAQMDKQNDPMSPLVLLHGGTRPAMVGGQAVSGGWWDHFEGAAYIDSKRIDMWLDGFESILGRFEGADTDASRIVSDLNSFIWRNKGKTYWSR